MISAAGQTQLLVIKDYGQFNYRPTPCNNGPENVIVRTIFPKAGTVGWLDMRTGLKTV